MLSSLSEASWKQYDSGLKKWWEYCVNQNLDPLKDDKTQIMTFLAKEFENKASYGTINTCRSAIALLHGSGLGDDLHVKRFFKGVSKLRPTRPKYDSTWDPQLVLDHVSKWDNTKISLEKLSYKLVTLLALITAQRMQCLALIDIRNIEETAEAFVIKIPDNIKTSRANKIQPELIIPFFKQDKSVCVALTLKSYLERTSTLRETDHKLFIATRRPYKAVSTQTLSRWIKTTLGDSGIDIQKFDAYSTRHASTSAANRSGTSIDTIKRTAGWTNKSLTFTKFYNRKITTDRKSFALTILNRDKP